MPVLLKSITIIFIIQLLAACSSSGAALLNSFAKTGDYTKTSDIPYGTNPQNTLDVYLPKRTKNTTLNNKNSPVIIFFYGGCWGECSDLKKSNYLFVGQAFASRGYTTVIADLRQYPDVNFSGLMSDASNVINWVSKNITRYGGDSERLVLVGHSSGAHIASMLALNPQYLGNNKKSIRGFVGLAGPYDFLPLDEEYQRVLFNPANNYANSQPINFVSAQSPPLLLLHGRDDTTVNKVNSINLSQKAQKLGVRQHLIIYPSHNHVGLLTALSRPFQSRSSVLKDILNFISSLR